MDYSACTTLDNLLEVCEKKDRTITFQNVKPQVFKMLKCVVKKEHLYLCNTENNVCEDLPARKKEQVMLPLKLHMSDDEKEDKTEDV